MRAVRHTVGGEHDRALRRSARDFGSVGLEAARRRGARLHDRGAADMRRADLAHDPRKAVEAALLGNGGAEHAEIEARAIWRVADTPGVGKSLLLGKNWLGKLDLRDKQAMARFNHYTSRTSRGS